MDTETLRQWLLRQPKPVRVRISGDDRETQTLASSGKWRELAETIGTLGAELVEALDDKGNVTRAIRAEDLVPPPIEPTTTAEEQQANALMAADPENARLIIFARLIADAYRHSSDVAFERLATLFETVVRRSDSLERTVSALERVVQRQAMQAAVEGVDTGDESLEKTMLSAFLSGKKKAETTNGSKPSEES